MVEYKTISARLTREEFTQVKNYLDKNGLKINKFIRDIVIAEISKPFPHIIAGRNKIEYDKSSDSFAWIILLDEGKEIKVLDNISYDYLNDLIEGIRTAFDERNSVIGKLNDSSVAVPKSFLKGKVKENA